MIQSSSWRVFFSTTSPIFLGHKIKSSHVVGPAWERGGMEIDK